MTNKKDTQVVWIYPDISRGKYWEPVVKRFRQQYKKSTFYTGKIWSNYDCSDLESVFKVIGKTEFKGKNKNRNGYLKGFIYASPKIIFPLLKLKPKVIFASAFSIWTILALLLKPITGSKLAIMYDGCAPTTDVSDSNFRIFVRKIISNFTDAFVANSKAAHNYIETVLNVSSDKIFQITYLVPDISSLSNGGLLSDTKIEKLESIKLLYVGQLIERKGIGVLIEACSNLLKAGIHDFSLVIVGDGPEQKNLIEASKNLGLEKYIYWVGWVDYSQLGNYFELADIFVFPTFEDSWGMVVLEAMAFGLPIICSTGANASEMVVDTKNGFLVNPGDSNAISAAIKKLVLRQDLITSMGEESKRLISQYNSATASNGFASIVENLTK